jgi:hypothetical protein
LNYGALARAVLPMHKAGPSFSSAEQGTKVATQGDPHSDAETLFKTKAPSPVVGTQVRVCVRNPVPHVAEQEETAEIKHL